MPAKEGIRPNLHSTAIFRPRSDHSAKSCIVSLRRQEGNLNRLTVARLTVPSALVPQLSQLQDSSQAIHRSSFRSRPQVHFEFGASAWKRNRVSCKVLDVLVTHRRALASRVYYSLEKELAFGGLRSETTQTGKGTCGRGVNPYPLTRRGLGKLRLR